MKNIARPTVKTLFTVLATLIVVSCWLCATFDSFYPFILPPIFLLIYISITDFKSVFFLLLACIPISMEIELPNGFSTDLPTEPLIIGLMLIYGLFALKNGFKNRHSAHLLESCKLSKRYSTEISKLFRHPITLLLLLHLGWTFITVINSENFFFSFKYLLAKIWYITTFYFLAALLLREKQDFKRFFWCIFIPLSITVAITLFRHALINFSFEDVNRVMFPFFRNHVMYACIVTVFIPYIVLGISWQKRGSGLWWVLIALLIMFLVAVQYSYTRTAYVAIMGAIGYYFVVKFRLTKFVVGIAVAGLIVFVAYLVNGNKYLDYAPKFEKTISHTKFDNLLEATAKGEDISTMERVYRWVAGFRMVGEKPFMGFGPNNFYNFYKSYTLTSFKTYVSDNPEGSTVHCYYLLVAVEQGLMGLLIFLTLLFYTLIKAEQVYYKSSAEYQGILLATLLSFVIVLILNLVNDIIETDKIGSFFFLSLALITNLDFNTSEAKS
jgi:O-antigen ligase